MAFLSETHHLRRLADRDVVIKTTYICDGQFFTRNTDGTVNDNISRGIRCRKEYFLHGKFIHVEKEFDSRIEYTYVTDASDETPHTCANCGFSGPIRDFADGCPCCDAASNLVYTDKDLGSKQHYDLVLKNPLYRIVTAVIDLLLSLCLSYLFLVKTSRTFNSYDVSKVFLYGGILALLLYYLFYLCDAYIILWPVKKYKEYRNRLQQDFWKRTGIDQQRFFNNLNYEAGAKYYSAPDLIDYDMMDYLDYREYQREGVLYVDVRLRVRLVALRGGRIRSDYVSDTFTLKHNALWTRLQPGINLIKCPNCGSNIDVTKKACDYCGSGIRDFREWIS